MNYPCAEHPCFIGQNTSIHGIEAAVFMGGSVTTFTVTPLLRLSQLRYCSGRNSVTILAVTRKGCLPNSYCSTSEYKVN